METGRVHVLVLLLLPGRDSLALVTAAAAAVLLLPSCHYLVHERDVGDGQPQGLDARQTLLVSEGGDLNKN